MLFDGDTAETGRLWLRSRGLAQRSIGNLRWQTDQATNPGFNLANLRIGSRTYPKGHPLVRGFGSGLFATPP